MPKFTILRHTSYCDSAEIEAEDAEQALRVAKRADLTDFSPFKMDGSAETYYEEYTQEDTDAS